MKQLIKDNKIISSIVLIIVLWVGYCFVTADGYESIGSLIAYKPSGEDAYSASKKYVLEKLKAPSSADFPIDYKAEYKGGNVWVVQGVVDAKNSYGSKLRSNWKAQIEYEGNKQWSLKRIAIY